MVSTRLQVAKELLSHLRTQAEYGKNDARRQISQEIFGAFDPDAMCAVVRKTHQFVLVSDLIFRHEHRLNESAITLEDLDTIMRLADAGNVHEQVADLEALFARIKERGGITDPQPAEETPADAGMVPFDQAVDEAAAASETFEKSDDEKAEAAKAAEALPKREES